MSRLTQGRAHSSSVKQVNFLLTNCDAPRDQRSKEYNAGRKGETKPMFCPICGADNQTPRGYCKKCGEWLPDVKKRGHTFGAETPQQIVLTNLFMSALSAVVALFSGIALYATYLGTDDAKWSVYIAGAFCLCIAGWQFSSFFIGLRLRQRLKKAQANPKSESSLKQARTSPALQAADTSNFVKAQSVTENTTERLQRVDRRQDGDSKY